MRPFFLSSTEVGKLTEFLDLLKSKGMIYPSDNSRFYADIEPLNSFREVSSLSNYQKLPGDWFLAVTDIVNSTRAVDNNRYKTVNILGASPIVGMLNMVDDDILPFAFAGDGCIIGIPAEMHERAKKVLGSCRKIGKREYGLDLRTALFPVSYLSDQGFDVWIARFRVSEVYCQAVFAGGGARHAEELLKSGAGEAYQVDVCEEAGAVDFSGLECRWKEIGQSGRKVLTLLVQSRLDLEQSAGVYDEVLLKLNNIFGRQTNPLAAERLNMHLSFAELIDETRFHTFGHSWFARLRYLFRVEIQVLLGKIFMRTGFRSQATDWSRYRSDLVQNSDHRKFDDMLRVVISGTAIQIEELETYLEKQYQKGQLVYGIHTAESAVITCMVFHYHERHIHFVDGAGGGYVKASEELKKRLGTTG